MDAAAEQRAAPAAVPSPAPPEGAVAVCRADEVPVGEALRVEPAGAPPIAVFNVDGELLAVDDTCTHQDASLAEGWLEDGQVECPLHASCFDLRTGRVSGPPARRPVRTHAVAVVDGVVHVSIGTPARSA